VFNASSLSAASHISSIMVRYFIELPPNTSQAT
jgi:hypothetical protein